MKRASTVSPDNLKVMLWGREIGTLTWNSRTCRSHFFFSPEYFKMSVDVAPIIAPKDSVESHFAIYGDSVNSVYQNLPPFIADSLPDDWGNLLFDQWFRNKGLHEKDKTPIAKLSFIGKRAMGAFEFVPCEETDFVGDENVSLPGLYSLASRIEEERDKIVIHPEESLTEKALLAVGTSAGGRFKKAVIAVAPDGSIHSGQTLLNPDWKYYIVKFNNPALCLSEVEKTYYELAKSSGIEMAESDMILVDGLWHFRTERFDRRDGRKILVMSLAAINPDAQSYEDLFTTCRRLRVPENEIYQLFRRMVFNFLASNTDDHAKNFSFILDDDGGWHLSPAYDVNFIFRTLNSAETNHCFSMRGKRASVTRQDLISFAKEHDVKNYETVISDIEKVLDRFEPVARDNGVRGDIIEVISRRFHQIRCEMDGLSSSSFDANWPSFEIDGHSVDCFHFEKEEKGAVRIIAAVDGKLIKRIISPSHPDYLVIMNNFNGTSESLKRLLAKRYLL